MKLDPSAWGPPRGLDALLAFDRIALFGASRGAVLPEELLKRRGKDVALYFDNAAAKQGTVFRGRPVHAPEDAADFVASGGAIVIASAYAGEIAGQLLGEMRLPVENVFPYVGAIFEGHYGREGVEPQIERTELAVERLADAESRSYLADLLRFRWTMDPRLLPSNPRGGGRYTYRGIGFGPRPGEVIVDCGAYTGDTAEIFLEEAKGDCTILAIEPMEPSFRALTGWIAANGLEDQVRALRCGVGAAPGSARLTYDVDGHEDGSSLRGHLSGEAGETVPVETIDRLCEGYENVGLIKMDIEGFEADALRGAARTIARCRPDLAISAYHRPQDPWELPSLIDAIAPGYSIYAGHHPHATYEIEYYCVHPQRARRA